MKQLLIFSFVAAISAGVAGYLTTTTFQEPVVETLESLQENEARIKQVVEQSMPATVTVSDGVGSGSGVIVSADGLVLTAAHVLLTGGSEFTIVFADGREVSATALGKNLDVDAGMLQIDEEGPWPFVPMADLEKLKAGDWCVALGYPGGYQLGRTPPVRVGRVLANAKTVLLSDSALIGGDSGGPLFNLDGEVIGIHSSIGATVDQNRHVPVQLFIDDWDRLKSGEQWGQLGRLVELDPNRPMLGIVMADEESPSVITGIAGDSPAEKAGLQVADRVLTIENREVDSILDVQTIVSQRAVGDEVTMKVLRGEIEKTFRVRLARKSELSLPSP